MGLPASNKRPTLNSSFYQEANYKQIEQLEAVEKARSCDTCHHAVSAAGPQFAYPDVVAVPVATARGSGRGINSESNSSGSTSTVDSSTPSACLHSQQPDTTTSPSTWAPSPIQTHQTLVNHIIVGSTTTISRSLLPQATVLIAEVEEETRAAGGAAAIAGVEFGLWGWV